MPNELPTRGYNVGTQVGINRGPFRPYEILSLQGNRAIVSDGLTKKKNLPLTNIRSWENVVSPNRKFRQGKKPTTDFQTLSNYEAKHTPRKELEVRPESFIVEADFDASAILPEKSDESKSRVLLLFGFHEQDQDEPPMLMPFPLVKGEGEEKAEKMNNWLTQRLRPIYAERFKVGEDILRFPLLKDLGPILSPYMRQEIGYGLMSLALETDTNQLLPPSERMQKALLNTGNMFLLSLGIKWQIEPEQLEQLTEFYNTHFAQILGPIPERVHPDVATTDALLHVFKDTIKLEAALGQMTELFGMGHGGIYMIQKIVQRGGSVEIVHGPQVPVNYGTPIGAGYMGLNFK